MTATPAPARMPRQPIRHRLAERGIDFSLLLLLPAVAVIAGLFLYPFIYGVGISFQPQAGGGVFANYKNFFTDSYQSGSILKTLRLALPVALVSVGLAAPLAYQCRRDFRGRKVVTLVVMLPITFGSILIAQGMPRVFSPYGWANLLLNDVGLPQANLIYNYWGTFIAAVLTTLPLSFLMMMGFFGGIDRSLEHAAATLGAGRAARFWRIILPLAAPGILTAFMLACVEAFAIFPSAILVGQPDNQTHVLTIPIYQAASQNSDYTQASAIAIVLTAIELLILALAVFVRGLLFKGPATGGKG
ncbi:ABC transporter permease [Actinocrinis sp.]|uniref:ABC transporter permease n=1 Tax=Actinocrinis sp. TaxID=1920516 RepID=UPI002BBF6870|nr:ABC transporter permease subunit [Actinocrinis sp.]HXR69728.1 ABC transporter permease subunit [Actinocrinis sp.]